MDFYVKNQPKNKISSVQLTPMKHCTRQYIICKYSRRQIHFFVSGPSAFFIGDL